MFELGQSVSMLFKHKNLPKSSITTHHSLQKRKWILPLLLAVVSPSSRVEDGVDIVKMLLSGPAGNDRSLRASDGPRELGQQLAKFRPLKLRCIVVIEAKTLDTESS